MASFEVKKNYHKYVLKGKKILSNSKIDLREEKDENMHNFVIKENRRNKGLMKESKSLPYLNIITSKDHSKLVSIPDTPKALTKSKVSSKFPPVRNSSYSNLFSQQKYVIFQPIFIPKSKVTIRLK